MIPILKAGKDGEIPRTYRLINLLPALAMFFEKIILKRVDDIDKKRHITPDTQFGFRQ